MLAIRSARYYVEWWESRATCRLSCRPTQPSEARRFPEEFKLDEAAKNRKGMSHVVFYQGEPVASVKVGFRAAATRAKLPGMMSHMLRHTAATWMAQVGRPLEEVARFLGDTVHRVEKVYAHHSPEYLRAATGALAGSPRSSPGIVETSGPKNP
jgi:integrase